MNRSFTILFSGLIVALLGLAVWILVLVPGFVAKSVREQLVLKTGRTLLINGGTSLQFSPQLGVALRNVSIAGAEINSEPILIAKALVAPASFMQLLTMQISGQEIVLQEPVFTMQYDAAGQSNILNTQATENTEAKTLPMRVRFEKAVLRYIDEPNAKSFIATDLEGLADFDAEGESHINAVMTVSDERAHVAANLKSLSRAFHDGSPFDFNLDAGGASISYGGRIVAKRSVELAGQLRVDTGDASRLFKWLGLDFHGLKNNVPLAVTAALESNQASIDFKNSEIALAGMKAKGGISVANKTQKPQINLNLNFENLNTDLFLDAGQNVSWNEKPIDLHNFNVADVSYNIAVKKLRIGGFQTEDAQISGSLKNGLWASTINGPNLGEAKIDFYSQDAPAKLKLELAIALADAKSFMQQFAAMEWFSGAMALNGRFETQGISQSELIGALDGQLELKSGEAVFKGVSLSALAGKAFVQAVTGWDGGETEPVSFNSKFIIADAIATLQENSLTAPGVKIGATGDIDILRQALSLSARVKPSSGDTKPVQLAVEGPWAKPQISAKDIQ